MVFLADSSAALQEVVEAAVGVFEIKMGSQEREVAVLMFTSMIAEVD